MRKADKNAIPKSQQKYGFFQSEREIFEKLALELGLIRISRIHRNDIAFCRHPLTFLMEAADDIAYRLVDFEDGCRHNLICLDRQYSVLFGLKEVKLTPRDILVDLAEPKKSDQRKLSDKVDELIQRDRSSDAIAYLRAKAIASLAHQVFSVFQKNYENIMHGRFDVSLIDNCSKHTRDNLSAIEWLVRTCVYDYSPVLECEAAGYEVMNSLIDAFAIATNVCITCGDDETARQKAFKKLIPKEFRPKEEKELEKLTFDDKYERLMFILDYVSGMTDEFALRRYRNIKGISLPRSR